MKNHYKLLFMLVLLLTGKMAVGQETGLNSQVGNGGRAGDKPFVGLGISIPLHKLFGPKKGKPVFVPTEQRAGVLSDSVFLAIKTDSAKTDSAVVTPLLSVSSVERATQVDLPEVEVTAPRLPGPGQTMPDLGQPMPGFGGYNPGDTYPGDGGSTGPMGPTQETPCQECQRLQDQAMEAKINAAYSSFRYEVLFGCSTAAGASYATANAVLIWLNLVPIIGAPAVQAIAILTGGGSFALCIENRYAQYESAKADARATCAVNKAQCGCNN